MQGTEAGGQARGLPGGEARAKGSAGEVLGVFLRLGLTSFGGPIAHLGYFRDEFVARRRWLAEDDYAELVALCQFLPGPASSQVGFAIGMMRAGWAGALAAFAGFTLPSAVVMAVLGMMAVGLAPGGLAEGLVHGLKLAAVAIVGQAVLGMARSLCPDGPRALIAAGAVVVLAALPTALGMIGAIALGGLAGRMLGLAGGAGPGSGGATLHLPVSRRTGIAALALLLAGLVGLPLLADRAQGLALADAVFRAGAMVFGGGHVVLPLLQAEVVGPGWVSQDAFLAGYGAAQAMPGPLFTIASYLGAAAGPAPNGALGALIATLAVFLPGFLLLTGVLPFWAALRARAGMRAAMAGANAAVVGILGAALYAPVFVGAVGGMADFALALLAFVLLVACKAPPLAVVALAAAGGMALAG